MHADKTSLEYLLRCRINDMVYREVDVQTKRQEQELAEWRKKYENAEERRRNTEYLLELSRVGGKANVLHEQLTQILQKERSKVEEKFHRKIQELKERGKAKGGGSRGGGILGDGDEGDGQGGKARL